MDFREVTQGQSTAANTTTFGKFRTRAISIYRISMYSTWITLVSLDELRIILIDQAIDVF